MTLATLPSGRPLGKTPARPGSVSLTFDSILRADTAKPVVPEEFGDLAAKIKLWGMNANDRYGDCVPAAQGHGSKLFVLMGTGKSLSVSAVDSVKDYASINGVPYPIEPGGPHDSGTDMQVAASYWRKTGMLDATGKRHKIDVYASVNIHSLDDLALAAYLTGAVLIGIQCPDSAETQFDAGRPWTVVKGSTVQGGHCILIVGRAANGNFLAVTWGKCIEITPAFLKKYLDEAIAPVSLEAFKAGKLGAFSEAEITAFLKSVA